MRLQHGHRARVVRVALRGRRPPAEDDAAGRLRLVVGEPQPAAAPVPPLLTPGRVRPDPPAAPRGRGLGGGEQEVELLPDVSLPLWVLVLGAEAEEQESLSCPQVRRPLPQRRDGGLHEIRDRVRLGERR